MYHKGVCTLGVEEHGGCMDEGRIVNPGRKEQRHQDHLRYDACHKGLPLAAVVREKQARARGMLVHSLPAMCARHFPI